MANIDVKTIGGWLIAILLSGITALTASSSRLSKIETKQEIQDVKIEAIQGVQREILQNVKETNTTVNDIKIQLTNKADKKYIR